MLRPNPILPVFAILSGAFLVVPPILVAQVIRSEIEAVRVDVTVTNRDGTFRSGLTAQDFEVFDDGRLQALTGFSNTPSALNIVLMLDMSDSMMPHVRRLGAAATAFVQGLKEGDRGAIRSLHTPGILRSDIQSLHEDLSLLTLGERSSIWQGIEDASAMLAGSDGRRSIIIATDGHDTDDELRALTAELRFQQLLKLLSSPLSTGRSAVGTLESRAVQLYVVALPGARVARELRRVAEDSGGRIVDFGRDVHPPELFDPLLDELRQQYLLSFAPSSRDGRIHRIDVRVKQRGLTVRARRSYQAGSS